MVEVLYVVRFQVLMDGRAIPAAEVPLLVRTRLEAMLPQEGDAVPDLPASFAGTSVLELDDAIRPGFLVVRSAAWVPGQGEGHFTAGGVVLPAVVRLTDSGRHWVQDRIAAAERKGWQQVASEAELRMTGDFVVETQDGEGAPEISLAPGPRVLPLTNIRDDVEVLHSGRDDHGPYLVLKAGEETLEASFEIGTPPARGTRGRMSADGFVPYPDQTLRRRPELDDGDQLGWMSQARPDGFTAPRGIVPGADTPADP